jgi:hypothetical protein
MSKENIQLRKIAAYATIIATIIALLTLLNDCNKGNIDINNTVSPVINVSSSSLLDNTSRRDTVVNIYVTEPQVERKTARLTNDVKKNPKPLAIPHTEDIAQPKPLNKDEYVYELSQNDIAIIIVDENDNPVNKVTSEIANYFRRRGYVVTESLFKQNFYKSPYVQQLEFVDSRLFDLFNLQVYAKNVFFGRYSKSIKEGSYTTYVCIGQLDAKIISCVKKSTVNSRPLYTSNGFNDKLRAERGTIEKLIEQLEEWNPNL